MNEKTCFIDELKEGYQQGYEQGHLRTLAVSVRCGAMTEEKAAEKADSLSKNSVNRSHFWKKIKQS